MSVKHDARLRRFARARNLSGQLSRAAMESAVLAALVAAIAINIVLFGWAQSKLQDEAIVHARIAADNSAAAVLFADSRSATETLSFLRGNSEVVSAVTYSEGGGEFARYDGKPATRQQLFVGAKEFSVEAPIEHDGRHLGKVVLTVSLIPLWNRFSWLAFISVSAAFLGVAFAKLRVSRVRREVRETEESLDKLAFFDQVTGLYNRHAAKEMLEDYVSTSDRGFVVALLDLDDFKLINDTLGHKAGDDLLLNLGSRLRAMCGNEGTVFRLGGDEFVVIWEKPDTPEHFEALGHRMVSTLAQPLIVGSRVLFAKASVGLAGFPLHAESAQELLRAADTAMYQAKSAGKNTFAVYDVSMGASTAQRLKTSTELSMALETSQLQLHYQPIVNLAQGTLIGVEALVRWMHPERGLLTAAQFIDIAEESGQVIQLGGWVLETAARQLKQWESQGLDHLFIAVNVSAKQFKRNVILGQVQHALRTTGANPSRLQIELTEHTLVEDIESNVQCLSTLRSMGIRIAIDDFGTGLSSLAYLKRLPIDKLKVDRSFVNDIGATEEDRAIVATIVNLAHALKLEVVAEGIETNEQVKTLRELHADHGQGYLFGKPMEADALMEACKQSITELAV